MNTFIWLAALATVILSVTAIENKKPAFQKSIKDLGDEIRDRRNLEYSLTLPHSHVASFRSLERRISNTPAETSPPRNFGILYQGRPSYGLTRRSRPSLPAPPYAVQMEPMVQYSQKDPLYDLNASENLEDGITRNEIQAQAKILTVGPGDQLTDSNQVGVDNVYAAAHTGNYPGQPGPPYGPLLVPYYEHPEPIIEIIIKESNESLPALPILSQPIGPRPKEPVQVFYVKYEQNPHGKDIIYDPPIPAITPPSNGEPDHHEEHTTIAPEFHTLPPLPSTTLRAIIRPDSEHYHSDSGVRITFGSEAKSHSADSHDSFLSEGHEESAQHISVAFPQPSAAPLKQAPPPTSQFHKRQQTIVHDQQPFQTQNFQQNVKYQKNQQHAQQRIQYQPNFPPQNYQQLPHANTPHEPFRSQSNHFQRLPEFNGPPQGSSQGPPRGPPQLPPRGPPQSAPQLSRPIPNFRPRPPSDGPPPSFQQRPNFSQERPLSTFQQRPDSPPPSFQQRPSHTPSGPPPAFQQLPAQNGPPPSFQHRPTQVSDRPPPSFLQRPIQTPDGPPPSFQQRPTHSSDGPPPQRSPFPSGPQRPFHQGPQPQQLQFNEHEYLQQNYHTITTEHVEPSQQLPRKPAQNFREPQRNPIQAPIPLSQEEYNQRYNEQVKLLQQQEQQRAQQRPTLHQSSQVGSTLRFQQQPIPQQQPKPTPTQINPPLLPKPIPQHQNQHSNLNINEQFNQFNQQPQNLRPQPPLNQQPQQFQQQIPGGQFIPPGGELIASIPKYEQHLLITPAPQIQHHQNNLQNTHQNTQQTQVQPQSLPIPSPLVQQRQPQNLVQYDIQNQIQQQFKTQNSNVQISNNNEFLSAYEQNQQEILQLQAKLRQSEQEHQKLLGLSQKPNINNFPSSTPSSSKQSHQVDIHNQQYFNLRSNPNSADIQSDDIPALHVQNSQSKPYTSHNTNRPPLLYSTSGSASQSSTPRYVSSTPNSIVDKPNGDKKEKNKKPVDFELPDEVPDDLRQQLIDSGILDNAQISILDYDKVGDIPIESLPPDQLANFYGAGGGIQLSGSSPVAAVVKPNGERVRQVVEDQDVDQEEEGSKRIESYVDVYGKKKSVEMKVVHFDPSTAKGQQVANKYVQDGATRVAPVALNDHKYNRYLPLKVSGAQFPLPDVAELKGRKVTSVVVLAPVDYDFAKAEREGGRSERAAPNKAKGVSFVAGDALKRLVKTPTIENYKKWLEKENSTSPDLQSVVLLVTGAEDGTESDKEIFMYDVGTQTVSKLSGELSSAFVEVAETNAHSKDFDQLTVTDSGIVESTVKLAPQEDTQQKPAQKTQQKEIKYSNHKPVYTEIDPKKQNPTTKTSTKDKKVNNGAEYLAVTEKGGFPQVKLPNSAEILEFLSDIESPTYSGQESKLSGIRSSNSEEISDFLTGAESTGSKRIPSSAEVADFLNGDERPPNHVLISSGYSRMKLGRTLQNDE